MSLSSSSDSEGSTSESQEPLNDMVSMIYSSSGDCQNLRNCMWMAKKQTIDELESFVKLTLIII